LTCSCIDIPVCKHICVQAYRRIILCLYGVSDREGSVCAKIVDGWDTIRNNLLRSSLGELSKLRLGLVG
jgi:hypothetical protein